VATLITRPEDVDTLIFDERCVQNLARGLNRDLPLPVGIVVKGCDGRAVSMRITEGDFCARADRGHCGGLSGGESRRQELG